MSESKWRMTDEKNGHKWGWYRDWEYQCCRICGVVRRRDDKNSECRGPVRITMRDQGERDE